MGKSLFFLRRILTYFPVLRQKIRFVVYNQVRNFLLFKNVDQFLIHAGFSKGGIHNKNCHIHTVQYLFCLSDSKFSKMSFIINTRRINNYNRSHWKQLHGLAHRIRGSSFNIGNHSKFLTCHFIYNTGFSCISSAKKTDMYTVC